MYDYNLFMLELWRFWKISRNCLAGYA